ncbi:MAG: hypothetical protein V3R88_10335 [Alphaproteobacteria bacterium]
MRPLVAFAALLVGLALSACFGPPESVVALSEPGETAYDARLLGDWHYMEGDTEGFRLHIAPGEEDGVLDIVGVMLDWNTSDPVRWLRATAHASEIDGRTYYNVKRLAGVGDDYSADEPPGFAIMRTEIGDDGSLSLRFMDLDFMAKLVDKGRLKGRIIEGHSKGDDPTYLMLDVSRQELIALIREFPSEKLFGDPGRFRRIAPAD